MRWVFSIHSVFGFGNGGVTEGDVAGWLDKSQPTVSRRLNGEIPFRRDELEILDEALGERGALLRQAGYVPQDAYPTASRYLDEAWLLRRLDEAEAISSNRDASWSVSEGYLKMLLSYLAPLREDRLVEKYRTRLQLDLLDIASERFGVTAGIIRSARSLGGTVNESKDRELTYRYETAMMGFAAGAGHYERGLNHQRWALTIAEAWDKLDPQRAWDQLQVAHLLAITSPGSPESETIIETLKPQLWTVEYRPGEWPRPIDGASYLDVLLTEFSFYFHQGLLSRAGDLLDLILGKFMTSPYSSDTILVESSAAEWYAAHGQGRLMEAHLLRADTLIRRYERFWYGDEVDRIRGTLRNEHEQ